MKSIVEDIKEKLGDIYELSARLEISKLQVSNYASKFEAFVIFGLVSFALPRKQLPFENASYDTQAYLLFFRANELSNHIYVSGYRILWVFYSFHLFSFIVMLQSNRNKYATKT